MSPISASIALIAEVRLVGSAASAGPPLGYVFAPTSVCNSLRATTKFPSFANVALIAVISPISLCNFCNAPVTVSVEPIFAIEVLPTNPVKVFKAVTTPLFTV